ncbi:MAG: LysM peptidoglycan-binding domain-containing protein, partial [Proteobacteria bacterium]|nr:LysM peptidoglycan-binding domain-containing protein [Pseudomonadota bacterium]
PAPTPRPAAAAPEVAAAAPPVAAPVPGAGAEVAVARPTFDIVRVTPEGQAVIAGRAEPGAEVTVQAGGEAFAVTRADPFGEWVVAPEGPLAAGPQEITLRAVTPDGIVTRSNQVVTVVVPGDAGPPGDRAVAVLQDREGAAAPRLLQGAIPDPGARAGELTLDAVQYDDAGNVVLSGKARTGTEIRVFVDDNAVGIGAPDEAGFWQMTPDQPLDVGRHLLRLEQVDVAGIVVARVELPFMRAAPVAGLAAGEVIVQPGTNLWRIARATYGQGLLYTVIFLANADQIDDPDLIYPGQIFTLLAPPQN